MKKIFLFLPILFIVNFSFSQITETFTFTGVTPTGLNISSTSETKNGITVTFTEPSGNNLNSYNNAGGALNTTGGAVTTNSSTAVTHFDVTFSQEVNILSINFLESTGNNFSGVNWTVTQTAGSGSNSPVSFASQGTSNNIVFNWTSVSSFRVTSNASTNGYGIDIINLGTASFTEDFVTETNGSTTFTDNGQSFTISTYNSATKQFDINQSYPGTGWNGLANDNGYIDNDQNVYASPSFGIETSDGANFLVKKFYIYLANSGNGLGVSGTLQIEGKKNGSQEFIINTSSGFVGSTATNNGFTEIDLTTYGGSNNSNTAIDELVLSMGGNFQYVAFDAFSWEAAPIGPVGVSVSASPVSCNGGSDGSITATTTPGTANYSYTWSNGATTSNTSSLTNTISSLFAGTYTVTVTDDNGTTATASAYISQPTILSATGTTSSNVSCNGGSDGAVGVNAQGGAGVYTYSWSNGATNSSITSLSAGTYTVTITDANGCTTTDVTTVSQPTDLVASASVASGVSCNGDSNGQVLASGAGGTGVYTYSWNTGGTSALETGLGTGNYYVTVTDGNGCTDSANVHLTQPSALLVSVTDTDVSCSGTNDGSGTASPSGGTGTYTYLWSNGATTASISNLTAGIYTTTVSDVSGCTATASITVTTPTSMTNSTSTNSNVSCNGGSDGSATINVAGGTPSYTYLWSNGETTATATSLSAGTFTVTATDANGCTLTDNVSISQPTVLSATSSSSNVSTNGGNDGSASASGLGGSSPYTYLWSNGSTSSTASGLAAGTYTVSVTDNKGCGPVTASETITQPAGINVSINAQTNVSCNGLSDGSLTASASTGTSPYTYSWSNGATAATAGGLTAGTYTVTATDNNGITATTSATITQPVSLVSSSVIDSNVTCNGFSDGGATSSATGGTAPYTYSWSNAATTASITGVLAGTYSVTVTDANGCTDSSSSTITEPAVLNAATTLDAIDTGGGTGAATASATGGTPTYTYLWSNGATSASINSLAAGTYTTTVTDNFGCTDSELIVIPAGPSVSITAKTNVSCSGLLDGSAAATASSGTSPYFYQWSSGDTLSTAGSSTISFKPAGTYTVTVTDVNGYTATTSASITQPSPLSATASTSSNVSCNGGNDGSASIGGSGGSFPYQYMWSSGDTSSSAFNLAAGTYTVTITDANGCTLTDLTTITEPAQLISAIALDSNDMGNGGGATASAMGGSAPYTYLWSNAATTASITGVAAGTYVTTVTDNNGCTDTESIVITAGPIPTASVTSNVSCNGLSDGAATVNVISGAMPYKYLWSSGDTSISAFNLAAGTYTVTVTDVNMLTGIDSVTITEPSILFSTSVVDSNATCKDDLNGGITALPIGGTTPYTYSWNNGATTASITGIAAGTYSVTITDANGCTVLNSSTVTEPDSIIFNLTRMLDVTCNGGADGGFIYSISGGTPNISGTDTNYLAYSNLGVGPISISDSLRGLPAGPFIFVVGDDNGCSSDTITLNITEPTAVLAASVVDSNISCNGFTDGGATASATGGIAPYTYVWSNSATSASITGVAAGTYTVTITDNNGCTFTTSSTITEPAVLAAATVVDSNITCNGFLDGGATASATGGTMPYTYAWSNSATTASITGVAAGTYSITITDANSCTSSSTISITEPAVLAAATVIDSNVTCNTFSNGGATASATGGTAPYTYLWNNTATTASITGVTAGTYSVTITDANSCTSSSNVSITEPFVLVASSVVDSNATCLGFTDGGASSTAMGGTAPYTYAWSNGATTASITGVADGTYTVTITDNNGCTGTSSSSITVVDTIKPVVLTQNITIYLDASGAASITTADVDNGTSDACGAPTLSLDVSSFTCAEVGANTVYLRATDVNNNIDSAMATVTVIDTIKPTVITQNINAYLDATGNVSITASDVDNSTTDICGAPTLSLDITSFTCAEVGANTVYLIATDVNGNIDSAMATVTVIDTIKPVVVTQNINVYLDAAGTASIVPADIDNGTNNACGTPTLSLDVSSFTCAEVGANTVYLIATDVNNNIDSAMATVTVIDTIKPTVITQNINAYLDATGNVSITTADVDNGTTDICGAPSLSLDVSSFTCAEVGANTVYLIATDVNNNIDSAMATVTVIDTIKPTVITQNINAYLDATGNVSITTADVDNGTTDICGAPSLSLDVSSFTCAEVGANTVTLTATDVNANVNSATAVVTVIDTVRPNVLTQAITIYLDASGAASITTADVDNGTSDACGAPTLSLSKSVFACSDAGANTVQLIATDANSNVDSAAVVVTVLDTIKPLISNCVPNIFSTTDVTGCTTVINWTAPTAADNCNVDSLISSHNPGDVFPIGTTTVTYIAYDPSMNTDTCTFDIVVTDAFSPIITNMPADITISNDVGRCDAVVTWTVPSASDNCNVDSLVSTAQSGDIFAVGTTMVYYTAYDPSINTSVDSFMVTVNDTELPTITCPSDIAQCDSIVTWTSPMGNDNCGVASTLRSDASLLNSGDEFPSDSTITISYQVTDIHNNQTTCEFDVNVFDPPIARAGEDLTARDIEPIRIASSAKNDASVMWTPFEDLDDETAVSPLANPQVTTEYIMTVTSTEGCTDTDTMTIDVTVVQDLEQTTLFSPNGDGRNDTWVVNKPELIQGCRLIIVNRNGTEVFSTTSYNNDWDATINGSELPEGTYFYVIDCPDGREFNGPISVIREKR